MPDEPKSPHATSGTREIIFELVRREPGITLRDLGVASAHGRGTVEYHLYELEKARRIHVVRVARSRRYFVRGLSPAEILRVAVLRHERTGEIARVVARNPGIMQRDLTQEVSVSRKVLRGCVGLLVRAGLLEERRDELHRRYYPTSSLRDAIERPPATRDEAPGGGAPPSFRT